MSRGSAGSEAFRPPRRQRGGLATAGGIGFLVRKHGLTIDHVVAAELVLADGTFVRADADSHPDLLWAVRGAGGNFGVVTALELEAYEVGDIVFSSIAFDAGATPTLLEQWGSHIEAAPRELTSFLSLVAQRNNAPIAWLYSVYAGDDTAAATEALTPLLGIGPLVPERLHDAYPGETLPRLRRLKALYDPDDVFNQNFSIPPAEEASRLQPALRAT